jgi:hypothetical protein
MQGARLAQLLPHGHHAMAEFEPIPPPPGEGDEHHDGHQDGSDHYAGDPAHGGSSGGLNVSPLIRKRSSSVKAPTPGLAVRCVGNGLGHWGSFLNHVSLAEPVAHAQALELRQPELGVRIGRAASTAADVCFGRALCYCWCVGGLCSVCRR